LDRRTDVRECENFDGYQIYNFAVTNPCAQLNFVVGRGMLSLFIWSGSLLARKHFFGRQLLGLEKQPPLSR